jgi:hypothetical protein
VVDEAPGVGQQRRAFSPSPASRSAVGVWTGPPNALDAPKPTSSSRIISTFGAPSGGRRGAIGGRASGRSRMSKANGPW